MSGCLEKEIENIIGKFQGNNLEYVNTVYGSNEKAKTKLYELIWEPMEQHLKGLKNIYYSPSGLLHKISFSAIGIKKNTLLCDRYDINQESSTSSIAQSEKKQYTSNGNFLLVGAVEYNSDTTTNKTWSFLNGSKTETEQIKQLSSKNNQHVNYLIGEEATEEKIKTLSKTSNVIHIAKHGFFFPNPDLARNAFETYETEGKDIKFRGTTNYANWSFVNNKNPLMRSGIVLAKANDVWQRSATTPGEDGILTAEEVSNLDLRKTDLVVLSACETGLGDIKGSDEVYGLERGFKIAGARYLIMSLWQVADDETAEFMTMFYKNLYDLENIPAAFKKTQNEMRSKYDPYYWAAFVLIKLKT